MKNTGIRVLGDPYTLHGLHAVGEFCNLYYGIRNDPHEVVAVKLSREGTSEDLQALRRECETIGIIRSAKVQGSDYFSAFLPEVVVPASVENVCGPGGYIGTANLFRWRSGFQYTFEDVLRKYPGGVDPKAAVWVWKRSLEFLGWLRRTGYVHGSLTPQHFLIHPRDHGVVFTGWSRATREGTPLLIRSQGYEAFYPKSTWDGGVVDSRVDLTMLSRSVIHLLGGSLKDHSVPSSVPGPLAELLYRYSEENLPEATDAWQVLEEVSQRAKKAYGENQFHNIHLG
jgi:hypothetical protein